MIDRRYNGRRYLICQRELPLGASIETSVVREAVSAKELPLGASVEISFSIESGERPFREWHHARRYRIQ